MESTQLGTSGIWELRAIEFLFKYLKPKWADTMVRDGSVRIGTLDDYRKLDEDAERGDSGEGTRTLHSDEQPRVYNKTEELPPILRGIECGHRGLSTNGPNAIVIENKIQNLYVYCMTEAFDVEVMNGFGGACIRIKDPASFLESLNDRFRQELLRRGDQPCDPVQFGRCVYVGRRQNYHSATPVHDCFIVTLQPRAMASALQM